MTISRLATIATGATAIVVTVAIITLSALYLGGASLLDVFLDASIVLKAGMFWTALLGLVALVVIIFALSSRTQAGTKPSALEIVLWLAAFATILIGLLTAAYSELNVQIVLAEVGPVHLAITAPMRVEALLALALGLWPATASLIAQQVVRARRQKTGA